MPKPVLFDTNPTDQQRAADAHPTVIENQDTAWIPGFSEIVKANDLSQSKVLSESDKAIYYARFGTGPKKLKFDFKWLPVVGVSGGPSYRADIDRMSYTRVGYAPVKVDPTAVEKSLMENFGIGLPPAAHIESDGTIRRLDDALFFVATEDPRYVAWQANLAAERSAYAEPEDTQGSRSYVPIEARREESSTLNFNV